MDIKQKIIPEGRANRPGRKLSLSKVTIHNTANTKKGANSAAHADYLVSTDEKISWHFTCDDIEVYQHLPTNEIGYHAKSGNSRSVGIEICENKGIDHSVANEKAAELTAHILKKNGLEVNDVVTHKSWTGKICPRLLLDKKDEGKKWNRFTELVQSYFDKETDGAEINIFNSNNLTLLPAIAEDDLLDLDHSLVLVG